jgi:hypothetical protein
MVMTGFTVRLTAALSVPLAEVATIVKGRAPLTVDESVASVSMAVAAVEDDRVTFALSKDGVTSEDNPLVERVTAPLKPVGVIVTFTTVEESRSTLGEALSTVTVSDPEDCGPLPPLPPPLPEPVPDPAPDPDPVPEPVPLPALAPFPPLLPWDPAEDPPEPPELLLPGACGVDPPCQSPLVPTLASPHPATERAMLAKRAAENRNRGRLSGVM